MDRGAWWATVHGVAVSDMTEQLSTRGLPPRLPAGVSPPREGQVCVGGEGALAVMTEVAPVPHMAVPPPALRGRKHLVRIQRTGPSITSPFAVHF